MSEHKSEGLKPHGQLRRQLVVGGACAAGSALVGTGVANAQAQAFPNKPIRFVIPFAAGSASDTIGRVFGEKITAALGQPVVIETRPGANGTIAALTVAKAPADGYTLLLGTNTTNAAIRSIMKNVPYDPEKDFAPVAFLGVLPQLVCVNINSPINTLNELIASAKANPGKIPYAWPNAVSKFATEMFASMAGIQLLSVPYKSSPQAMADLIGDQVSVYFSDPSIAGPQVRTGKVKALAVTSARRMQLFPNIPTVAEASGLTGYEMMGIFAIFAPAGTPREVIGLLNDTVRRASTEPDVKARFEGMALETQLGTPEEMAERFRQETARWTKFASLAGITPE